MQIFERGEIAILTVYFEDEDEGTIQPTGDVYAYIYAGASLYTSGVANYLGTEGVFEYRWDIPIGVDRGVWHVDFIGVYGGEGILERNQFRILHTGRD